MKLKDVIESANTGLDAIQRAPIVNYNTSIKCLRIGDISQRNNFENWGFSKVDEENYKKFKLKKNDILIARTGNTIGVNIIINKELNSVYNNGLIRLRIKNEYNPMYIYFFIQSKKFDNYIKSICFGTSTQPNMKINDLLEFEIPDIELSKQNKIVNILKKIDDKIELNNQTNDNLYKMMKIKFEDWITNLNKYEVSSLSKIANYTNGLAMQKFRPKDNEESLPVIKIKEMNDGITENTERCSTNIKDEVIINNGDVLFAWSGTLCMSIWGKGKAGLNQHIFKVTSDKYPKWFYYFWTLKHLNKFKMIAAGKATTMGHIKRGELDISEVLIPEDKELQEMHKIMQPLFNKYINNLIQNETLTQLRDTLLPKLMNGEIDLDKIEN